MGEGSASRPGRTLPQGKTRYPLHRRLDGPQGRSGQVRKISPPPGFNPRTVQPVGSRYTDWVIRPTLLVVSGFKTKPIIDYRKFMLGGVLSIILPVGGEMWPSVWYHNSELIMREYQLVHVWHAAHMDTKEACLSCTCSASSNMNRQQRRHLDHCSYQVHNSACCCEEHRKAINFIRFILQRQNAGHWSLQICGSVRQTNNFLTQFAHFINTNIKNHNYWYSKTCLKRTPYIPETWTNGK